MNGVELGKLIRRKLNDYTTKIVYVSAKDCYDRQLFDVQPLNFLPKPIDKMKLYDSIDLAIKLIDDRNQVFIFKDKEGSHRIKIKDILYFESFAHNFMIATTDGSYEFRSNLAEIMGELSNYGFIQVHRSYIINYEHIKLIKYEELVMFNDKSIPISRNKRKEVREMLMRLRGDKL